MSSHLAFLQEQIRIHNIALDVIRQIEYNMYKRYNSEVLKNMKYLSTFEVAKKWGLSARRVGILCSEGRIDGAQKAGKMWIIPEDAVKPADARIKSGKYIKTKNEEVDVK